MPFARVFPRFLLAAGLLAPLRAAETPAAPRPGGGELRLHKWSGEINVPDPVACAVDPWGRVYVAATTRRKVGDLDIREHTMWIPDDVALTSVEEKGEFFRRELAPGRLRAPRGGLRDHNGDGSIDWKDLTHHSERIYQLRDTDGDGTADRITVFAAGFNTEVTGIAAGVLWHDGWVYATIAPDLWRLRDNDDDGVADEREKLVSGFGLHIAYAGHDMHGPVAGPDGRIYWSIGDKGVNVTSREGRRFVFPNEGATLRMEPDGSGFEVYTRGNRNVQEPAFNEVGDLIGVDNDADQPAERERFVHLVEGSDSGWRCNFQYMGVRSPWMREGLWKPHFPGQPAYLLPPLLSYSDGPAGFKYHPGIALGENLRGTFLLNEFPSGKLRAFGAEPAGATYRMVDARVINEGIMGIGLAWHPDGSLFLADWIGGYPLDGQGAVWRADVAENARDSRREETRRVLEEGFGARSPLELLAQLGHPDQRVRQGAQFELVRRGRKAELLAVARGATVDPFARLHALWGYGQLLRRGSAEVAAVTPLLRDPDSEVRAQTAKLLGDAAAAGAAVESSGLAPLLADPSPRARLQAAIALGKLRDPAVVDALFALAERDGADPVLRHAAAFGLAGCADRPAMLARLVHPVATVRLIAVVALRRQGSPAAAEFLHDADPLVVAEAARAIHDDASIPAALPALAAVLAERPAGESVLRRAINAGLRLGTAEAADRLAGYALDDKTAAPLRAEALRALKVWRNPPPLDLVDGWARRFSPEPAGGVLAPRLPALLALRDPELKTLAIEVMIAHELRPEPAAGEAVVADGSASAELRAQALRLLAVDGRGAPAAIRSLDVALREDAPAALHRAALALLLPGAPDRLTAEAPRVLARRSLPEKQHVVALLARAGTPAADALLGGLGAELAAGKLEPGLSLDVLEALEARSAVAPALAAHVVAWGKRVDAAARPELLAGGDIARGRDLVANHLGANCTACHTVESSGGSEVGPGLRAIGAQRDPAYLLESLLNPSAQITTGYGLVAVTLKDGTEISGTLARETPSAVTVRLFDGQQRILPLAEIARRSAPVSVMPPMQGILQPREIRDVVGYLASLKGVRAPRKRDADPGG